MKPEELFDYMEKEAKTKLEPKTIEEFGGARSEGKTMTHGMAAAEPRIIASNLPKAQKTEYQDQITQLMATLENISRSNNGNTPRLGLYGDLSWDLVNMETDEWILGGNNVYADIEHITASYQEFSNLERALRDMQIEKVEFNRVANQLHRQNELRRKLPEVTTDAQ